MQEIKVGDRVKVREFESTVRAVLGSGRVMLDDAPDGEVRSVIRDERVEVIVPPVKVGDIIDHRDDLDRLPAGAVTICRNTGEVAVKTIRDDYLVPGEYDPHSRGYLDLPVEVLHLDGCC